MPVKTKREKATPTRPKLALVSSTKRCGACGEDLPLDAFWKNKAKPDGLQVQCKDCLRLRQEKYRATPAGQAQRKKQNATDSAREARRQYAATARGQVAAEKARKKHTAEVRRQARQIVRDLKESTTCADCGRSFHFAAMDLDHVQGQKKANIADMVMKTYSLDTLRAELAKCEVVCACCHRVRTFRRRNGQEVS